MYGQQDCGCGGHGEHHGEGHGERREGHGEDCGCGGHGHHGVRMGGRHHGYCGCGCRDRGWGHHGHGGFMPRHFISKGEVITRLEEYLTQLQAEAKGVEERLAELRKEEE